MKCRLRYLAAPFFVFAVALVAGAEPDWNQFRGPRGDGHAGPAALPTTWSEKEHVKWKTPIVGKAWSSPVIWKNQVWVTNALPDGKKLWANCLDLASGKVLQEILVFDVEIPQPPGVDKNSYASPTPFIEEGRIYVHFGAHGTACLDTASGTKLWERQDLECNHFRLPASSPIVWNDLLILTFDGFDLQYVIALDKQTGKTVWKTDRNIDYGSDNGDVMKAFSTPQVFDVGGKLQLVSPSAGACISYDPATGKELWRVRSGGMNAAGRPIMGQGLVFMGTADGGYKFFAVSPDGKGDVTESHVAWKAAKGAPRYASPLLVDDLLYTVNDKIITCLEAKTGEEVWQKRVNGTFTSSPIYAGGSLYFCNEEGTTYVLKPGRAANLVATNELEIGCLASPAVAGNALILRTKAALYCIEE